MILIGRWRNWQKEANQIFLPCNINMRKEKEAEKNKAYFELKIYKIFFLILLSTALSSEECIKGKSFLKEPS